MLLIVGYLGVVGGCTAWIAAYWSGGYLVETVYEGALAVGLGLAGLAAWRWTEVDHSHATDVSVDRRPARWMAASALVLAAAPAVLTFNAYDMHQQFRRFAGPLPADPHYRLIIAGGLSFTLGLLVASSGFTVLSFRPKNQVGLSSPNADERAPEAELSRKDIP